MNMPITEKEYFDLQEYWDYQRKVEYNKELAYDRTSKLFHAHEMTEVFPTIWSQVDPKIYMDPPSNYVPEEESLRLVGEDIEKWRAIPHRFSPLDESDRNEYD